MTAATTAASASRAWPSPPKQQLAQCTTCATEDTVSPHASAIALPVLPGQAYANLQTLRSRYPGIYTADGGFYDAVNPKTGSVGHRRLVLDQSMIMAALDDALTGRLQRYFAQDPESYAAKLYLGLGAHVDPLTGGLGTRRSADRGRPGHPSHAGVL